MADETAGREGLMAAYWAEYLALPERFIRQYTRPGDMVLDPFCGVGTTGRVAVELGRRFVGFEKDAGEAERAREWVSEAAEVGDAERA